MLISELADTSAAVAATRSRNAKRDLLAATLAAAAPDELEIAVSYLSGSLRQRRTGVGWRALTELPAPADRSSLTLREVDTAFEDLAATSGAGSVSDRGVQLAALFGRATRREQEFLRGLIAGELRQGALESAVQGGLAQAYGIELDILQRSAMLLGGISAAARVLAASGATGLESATLTVGIPIQPMLAASAPDPDAALAKVGTPAVADIKLDGIRVQVHRNGDQVRIFSRSLDDITERLPEVVAATLSLPVSEAVLDGEVLAQATDGRPAPFQLTAAQAATFGRDPGTDSALRVFFFDLLQLDGMSLLDQPLAVRSGLLDDRVPPELRVRRTQVSTADELSSFFTTSVDAGFEGIVLKHPASPYAAGRRQAHWIKVKPRHTFDLLVIAAEWGYGRRTGWLSNIHLAARDPAGGKPIMLGKTFKGMTDDMLRWQTEHFQELASGQRGQVVYLQPTTVVEIACDGLQTSNRYPGGVALRFARVLRYRTDKSAAEADTLAEIKRLTGYLAP